MNRELRREFQFFHEWSGGIVGEHAVGALALARAYLKLQAMIDRDQARVRWVQDEYFDLEGFTDDALTERKTRENLQSGLWEVRGCIVEVRCPKCKQWEQRASLWGIVSAFDQQDNYPKVVEGELASEAKLDTQELCTD